MVAEVASAIAPYKLTHVDGSGVQSFSKLVNMAIGKSECERILILSDKVRPTSEQVDHALSILDEGYGLVGYYRFAMFVLRKDLLRKIGVFDERFTGGGFEDCDILRRMMEADIAYWESESCEYVRMDSSWDPGAAYVWFREKWEESDTHVRRLRDEQLSNISLGDAESRKYLSWSESVLLPQSVGFKEKRFDRN